MFEGLIIMKHLIDFKGVQTFVWEIITITKGAATLSGFDISGDTITNTVVKLPGLTIPELTVRGWEPVSITDTIGVFKRRKYLHPLCIRDGKLEDASGTHQDLDPEG